MQQTLTPSFETLCATARPAGPEPTTTRSTGFLFNVSNRGISYFKLSIVWGGTSSNNALALHTESSEIPFETQVGVFFQFLWERPSVELRENPSPQERFIGAFRSRIVCEGKEEDREWPDRESAELTSAIAMATIDPSLITHSSWRLQTNLEYPSKTHSETLNSLHHSGVLEICVAAMETEVCPLVHNVWLIHWRQPYTQWSPEH